VLIDHHRRDLRDEWLDILTGQRLLKKPVLVFNFLIVVIHGWRSFCGTEHADVTLITLDFDDSFGATIKSAEGPLAFLRHIRTFAI
jgi:hypothetical protein